MKLAIMQPYFFPYIGYFQLVNAVDKFVFYDDVNFITRGWINRNKIQLNQKEHLITVPVANASQNRLINEIRIYKNPGKLRKTISHAYKKAPYYTSVMPVIDQILDCQTTQISELAAFSVTKTCEYLGINTAFEFSSKKYGSSQSLTKEDRLIEICKLNNAGIYINPVGGVELYEKAVFAKHGIHLQFLKTNPVQYRQFGEAFIPNLSIIDVMMFNDKAELQHLLNSFSLG